MFSCAFVDDALNYCFHYTARRKSMDLRSEQTLQVLLAEVWKTFNETKREIIAFHWGSKMLFIKRFFPHKKITSS